MKIALVFGLMVCGGAWADVLKSETAANLPEGAELVLKADVRFAPGKANGEMPEFAEDEDGDGVADYMDWCPKTARGETVIKDSGKTPDLTGCVTEKDAGRIPSTENLEGVVRACSLYAASSGKDRILGTGKVLTVRGESRLGTQGKGIGVEVPLKTAGGTDLTLVCRDDRRSGFVDIWFDGVRKFGFNTLTSHPPTIEGIEKLFKEIRIPKSEEIP